MSERQCASPHRRHFPQAFCSHFPRTVGVRQGTQFTLLEMSAQVLCKQTQEPLVSGTETVPTFTSPCCTNPRALKCSWGTAACCRSLLLPFTFLSDPFENTSSIVIVLAGSGSQTQHRAPGGRAHGAVPHGPPHTTSCFPALPRPLLRGHGTLAGEQQGSKVSAVF